MTISALPQLLKVDSELSAQATSLEAQLVALQEKRKGLQTVIAMFESGSAPKSADVAATTSSGKSRTAKATRSTSAKAASETKATKAAKAKKTAKTSATKAKPVGAKTVGAKSADDKNAKSTKTKTRKVKATRGQPAKAKVNSASAVKDTGAKRSGRTANWQKYVQDNYSKAALPDVIVGVLKAQPDNIFKIADVMNVVFKEDMPKTHFLKARNRVSNILSAGARDGEWYRGRGGTYSVSEKAIKTVG